MVDIFGNLNCIEHATGFDKMDCVCDMRFNIRIHDVYPIVFSVILAFHCLVFAPLKRAQVLDIGRRAGKRRRRDLANDEQYGSGIERRIFLWPLYPGADGKAARKERRSRHHRKSRF
ncbi:hypothetical protein [Rhizobium leguminosarum]